MEENLNLKSFINNLQDQLALQKNRLEINKRKNEKYTKQINREFSKEMYYSGKNPNSYLISGVKSQYENMKNCNFLCYFRIWTKMQRLWKCHKKYRFYEHWRAESLYRGFVEK